MTRRQRRQRDEALALAACTGAMLTLLPVAAHQLGLLRHLPDPPSPVFDSDGITGSTAAHPFGIPDGVLGLASYGVTFALLLAGRGRSPVAQRLLRAKLGADASAAAINVVRQPITFRRLCSWCTATALCTAAMVITARRALHE